MSLHGKNNLPVRSITSFRREIHNTRELAMSLEGEGATESKNGSLASMQGLPPTKSNLLKKRIDISGVCIICNADFENDWHIFIECPLAKECWRMVGLGLAVATKAAEFTTIKEVLLLVINELGGEQQLSLSC